MRAAAGLVFGLGLYALAGWALLYALGLIATIREALWATGLALLCGIALVGVTLVALLAIGLEVTLPVFVAVALLECAALAAAGWFVARGGSPRSRPAAVPLSRHERWIAWSVGAALTLYVLLEAVLSRNMPVGFDASHFWTQKAVALFTLDELDPNVFNNIDYATAADYPILQPVFVSTMFRATGGDYVESVPMLLLLLAGAGVAGAWFLLRRSSENVLWVFALVPLVPLVFTDALLSNADGTLAAFTGVGALAAALWVRERDLRLLLLAGVLLGAATNVKTEGTGFAAIVIVSAAVACAPWRGWRVLLPWAAGAGVLVAFKAPWALWMAVEEPAQHQQAAPLSDVLNPGFLADRLDNLELGAESVFAMLTDQGRWVWLIPCLVTLALASIAARRGRGASGFWLLSTGLGIVALCAVYWTTNTPNVANYIDVTQDRVVLTPMWLAALGLAHLLSMVELKAARE